MDQSELLRAGAVPARDRRGDGVVGHCARSERDRDHKKRRLWRLLGPRFPQMSPPLFFPMPVCGDFFLVCGACRYCVYAALAQTSDAALCYRIKIACRLFAPLCGLLSLLYFAWKSFARIRGVGKQARFSACNTIPQARSRQFRINRARHFMRERAHHCSYERERQRAHKKES